MLIACEHCHKQLNLPDEKIPDRPFAIKCIHCKQRLQIDPANPPTPQAAAPPPQAAPPAAAPAPPAAPTGTTAPMAAQLAAPAAPWAGQFKRLPPLHGVESQVFSKLYPVGGIVDLGTGDAPWMEPALGELGIRDVETFVSLEAMVEKLREIELGVLLIRVDKASLPPFEPLKPLYQLPLSLRRKTFVALLADNLRSLDGQLAFFLQMNCLVNAREIEKVPSVLRRAILFHLKHYRFWIDDQE